MPQQDNVESIDPKIRAFQQAMDAYYTHDFYQHMGLLVSILVISLQAITTLAVILDLQGTSPLTLIIPFLCAYVLTDFINGLVHMLMDNNSHYSSIVGPFIAAFHLHHLKPKYGNKHALKVYFYESGTKFWLVGYLVILALIQWTCHIPIGLHVCLVSMGVLSSIAEVSHFWCHNSDPENVVISFLQKTRVLLSKSHHRIHHTVDNKNYAFLNGMTDPLLNIISAWLFDGYKNNTDQHAKAYRGQETQNRYGDIALPIGYETVKKDVVYSDIETHKMKRKSSISNE